MIALFEGKTMIPSEPQTNRLIFLVGLSFILAALAGSGIGYMVGTKKAADQTAALAASRFDRAFGEMKDAWEQAGVHVDEVLKKKDQQLGLVYRE
ncbi:MAG TPA: hypothetical protein VFG64_03370, partial [Dongiaceae bacterium]|nr:hypothetical protein [Dongiaceae bacterium]